MSFMKELAILSNEGRRRGFTHYEYGVATRESEVHLVLGVLSDNTAVELFELNNEARAKAVINLLNSDRGWEDGHQEGIGEIGG